MQTITLKVDPAIAADLTSLRQHLTRSKKIPPHQIGEIQIERRSIDARGRVPKVQLRLAVYAPDELPEPEPALLDSLRSVADAPAVIIVGAGPAGLFAALELIEQGLRPLVFDRGKDVRARRRDLRAIQQFGQVDPHSNYCFGEGGAGTYSDGKLYTRSHKRGNISRTLRLLVEHGAKPDILIDAHPHIGSNKLPNIVANIRETIRHYGGEVHFGSHVTDLLLDRDRIRGIIVNEEREYTAEAVILATGHSARDVYYLLHKRGIRIESKPFALGVRIEHPQQLIDRIQYNQQPRDPNLPASSYRLACQVEDRGVFSFCMCPGGLVVPAATAPGELVVNGMSMSRRDSAYANSGTVVAVELEDLHAFRQHGPFQTLAFQQSVERRMFEDGDGSQRAPAQRLPDFVAGRPSATLPNTSYIPGLRSARLDQLLPESIYRRLRLGVKEFGRKMRGYYTDDAVVIGTESRTSAPIRIPRDADTYMHPEWDRFFPCGEGAGYAGGILSAAMDGQNVARAVGRRLANTKTPN